MVVRVDDIEITIGNRKRGDHGVYVGRPTALGNPFTIACGRTHAIERYRDWLTQKLREGDRVVRAAMETLRRKAITERKLQLVCWCAPLPCHAEVIAEELAKAIRENRTFKEKAA